MIDRENGLIRKRPTQLLLLLPYRLPQDCDSDKVAVQHILDMTALCDHSDSASSGPTAGDLYYDRRLYDEREEEEEEKGEGG